MLVASLLTLGSPHQLTGGYLYHLRLAELAPRHGARIELVSLPVLPFPLPAAFGRRALRRARDADVVVVDSIAAAYLAPWRPTPPAVAVLHQPPGGIDHGPLRRRAQAAMDRALYRHCSLLVLASDTLADDGLPPVPAVVVPPGRDVAPAPEGPSPDLRHGRHAALLSVGNWVRRKGTLELLEAFARLPPDLATLHLVGRTDAEPRYGRRVATRLARPDLAARVEVHGPVSRDEVARLYRAADVFVLASYREPYGTVYGEAMAAGLPVVGWRAGNLPHLADDGREGLVVDPGDRDGLAAALAHLAGDAPARERMAAAAAERGRRRPTWDETTARFVALLGDVAACGARRRRRRR
ncbi:MAG TPA: glycosyltransferase family 4 protein [Acidimicrobiales bacterium]|nr:glycosyltransferase family 4 protein [Acidimicrobiales bacterium]